MWMVPAEIGLQQIGAAALARLGDAERLEAPDRFADRRAADRQRRHQLALGRQAVAALQRGALDIVGQRFHDLLAAIHRGQGGDGRARAVELRPVACRRDPNWSDILAVLRAQTGCVKGSNQIWEAAQLGRIPRRHQLRCRTERPGRACKPEHAASDGKLQRMSGYE